MTARRAAAMLAASCALALGAASPAPAAPSEERFTLRSFGHDTRALRADGLRGSTTYAVTFPEGARQGPHTWWKLHLRVELHFPERGNGFIWVSAGTNGRTAASVEFDLRAWESERRIRWNSVDLVRGQVDHETTSPTVVVDFSNYLRTDGVSPGPGELEVSYERSSESARFDQLEVDPSTALVQTDDQPYDTAIDATPSIERHGSRWEASIPYRFRNVDPEPARAIVVTAAIRGTAAHLRGPHRQNLGDVDERAMGRFIVTGDHPGRYTVVLTARGAMRNDAASTAVVLHVEPSHERGLLSPINLAALGLGGLGTAIYLGPLRHRRTGDP